jgi:hypothetical protein
VERPGVLLNTQRRCIMVAFFRPVSHLAFFAAFLALVSPGVTAQETHYTLAAIRREAGNRDIAVFRLNLQGEVLSTATLRVDTKPVWMYPSGRILRGSVGETTHFARLSIPVTDRLNEALDKKTASVLDVRDDAEPETVLKWDSLTSSCASFLVGRNLLKPHPNPRFGELFLVAAGLQPSGRSFLVHPPLSHTESMKYLIMRLSVEDKDYRPTGAYPVFQQQYDRHFHILVLWDSAEKIWRHICGSENERYFFTNNVDMLNEKIVFYRIRNLMSVSASFMEEAPVISTEGGYEVCQYDTGTGELRVLTDRGQRWPGSPGEILWSPDGSRFLFMHAEEWYFGDPVHNEWGGPYVFEVATKKHYRPTGKCPVETAICWLPDSVHYLVNRSNLYNPVTGRPRAQEGYFVVDAVTRGEYPLILVADDPNLGDMIQGLGNQARQPSQFAFSPDGALLCFTAFFDQDGATYSGIFVMRNQPGAVPVLIERALLRQDYRGIPVLNYHAGPLTWLR